MYDAENSCLKKAAANLVTKEEVKTEPQKGIKYLFTTKTCPNCAMAKTALQEAKEDYVLIDDMELAQKYGVMQAPTLVVVAGDKTRKYVNASNIQKYIKER